MAFVPLQLLRSGKSDRAHYSWPADGGAPLFVSIDKSNKHVYASIGRFYHSYVLVIDYATGKRMKRLGYSRGGFGSPYGIVDAPNEVP